MATLANLIKNIDPPRQMTWAEYNALPTQIKNDGTQYYITDRDDAIQTAATTPALDKDGNSSNVQTELDSLNNDISNLLDGTVYAEKAKSFVNHHARGWHTDKYGRVEHNSPHHGDTWEIVNNAQNARPLSINLQSGEMKSNGRRICYGINTSYSKTYIGVGILNTSSRYIAFSVPMFINANVITLTKLSITLRPVEDGIYAYMKYGTNASSSIALGSSQVVIWENSAQKYADSIDSVTLERHQGWITFKIWFKNALVTASGGTTAIKTITPIAITCTPTLKFSA